MGRTSLQDVRSIGDPLQQWNWDLFIPRMPGGADSRQFTFRCQTASIPGIMMENTPVVLHGVELRYAGRANNSHQLPVTVLEARDAGTRDMFVRWRNLARSWQNNTGNYKDVYSTNIQLVLYDDIPSPIRTINIIGAWPETVDESTLDGQQSAAVTFNVTFSYDYADEPGSS